MHGCNTLQKTNKNDLNKIQTKLMLAREYTL